MQQMLVDLSDISGLQYQKKLAEREMQNDVSIKPLLLCVSSWDSYERREINERKHTIQSQNNIDFITNDDSRESIEQEESTAFNSRRGSILGEGPTSFREDASVLHSGFEPMPTRLQAECHNHYTGWVANHYLI
ncbi:hypothetical protein TNCV_1369851 [Trichonephila clavipes]|nr:hypothetical protein TNCV_1369851 [Trichonephila clavipes]